MQQKRFTLTLVDDVVISQRAATQGGHASLDYLPGATLLGAIAKQLYARLTPDDAYRVFHSGQVRFGNALPLTDTNRLAYPMPLCWHQLKGGPEAIQNYCLQPENVRNYQYKEAQLCNNRKTEQLGERFIALDGSVVQPARHLRMKTAIDPTTGRAKEAQLFGYMSLMRGMRFGFTVEADDAVPADLFAQVTAHLMGSLRLGRSRFSEYGRVAVEKAGWREDDKTPPLAQQMHELTLWLLADLALQDEWGEPVLYPQPQYLDLPTGKLIPEKSFIRSRRYAPFNAHYCRRELERVVLCMGSVLHFSLDKPVDFKELHESLSGGVGLYRQAGLGQVWLNPLLLSNPKPQLEALTLPEAPATTEETLQTPLPEGILEIPAAPLAQWLLSQVARDGRAQIIEKKVDEWIRVLRELYQSASLLVAASPGIRIGPSATQWGRVLELAKTPNLPAAEIRNRLFDGEQAICKEDDPEWGAEVLLASDNSIRSFRQWFERQVEVEMVNDNLLPTLLAQTSRQAVDVARAQEARRQKAEGC